MPEGNRNVDLLAISALVEPPGVVAQIVRPHDLRSRKDILQLRRMIKSSTQVRWSEYNRFLIQIRQVVRPGSQ